MAILHVLSHSPFTDSRLNSCLRVLGPDDAVLLCGDATYALHDATLNDRTLFALDEDVQARGLSVPDWATRVDYSGFVALSLRFDKVNTWL